MQNSNNGIERRDFLKLAGAAAAFSFTQKALSSPCSQISIIIDPDDSLTSGAPVKWAAERLRTALVAKGVMCHIVPSPEQASGSALHVLVASESSGIARDLPQARSALTGAESLRLTPGQVAQAPAVWVSAIDHRGFVYGLLELAERVRFGSDPAADLLLAEAVEEKPANEIRCVGRYFSSEIEDKPWFYDKDFWHEYLTALAASRFNRFQLAFGLEYDFPRGVTDDYLHLPYPYLVEVPGYESVRVMQLASPDGKRLPAPVPLSVEEREKNLTMLRFIATETAARGLHFQLGIWTHAYQWTDSPLAYHHIDGLTPETHALYCRDALAMLLKTCPEIQGLTLRVHGESGIPEGSYPFWKTVFEAISGCGRKIEVDMHAKGVNQTMIDIAVNTGMPVKLGAKYSAEHESLGYNQADIRPLEIPPPDDKGNGPMSISNGARRFTRYGYADYLQEGSPAKILFRLWPGTQRHLLSGDPELAAAFGRTSHFCGAVGLDICEPLTFKGREGSGQAGGRCAYADASLTPKADWKKFEYYYLLWGRHLYDPDADPESWRRYLKSEYGPGALSVETALANASRVLPLLTSAHLPSAANHEFWPEIYDNMPIVLGSEPNPYGDTPTPKCFGTVSPLDPQLFSTIVDHSADLLAGRLNAKYSPIEVAQWLEDFTAASTKALGQARAQATSTTSPAFRRMEEDILIQNGLGQFFAAKLRSGVLFEIYQKTGDPQAGKQALAQYKAARETWAAMATRANRVYVADIGYGEISRRRGHWSDRLPGIDKDIAAMQEKLQAAPPGATTHSPSTQRAIKAATGKPNRPAVQCTHTPPGSFQPGQPLALTLAVSQDSVKAVRLHYRHVDQAERWAAMGMQGGSGRYSASIPGDYTHSPYPLQYYFELQQASDAWLYPAFNATLSNQPYYAIAKRST
jgi:hypothetical protein